MKVAPLKGKAAFAHTMRSGKRFTERAITCIVTFQINGSTTNKDEENVVEPQIRVGVSIRKKAAKKATVRNRVKRLLRHSVRMVVREFTDAGYFEATPPIDRIILFCNSAPLTASLIKLDDILVDVRAVLRAAYDYSQKH